MTTINKSKKSNPVYNHEGVKARKVPPLLQLRRSVLSCLLWEDEFYEDGQEIATRIRSLCQSVPPSAISALAIQARGEYKLRHVPLLLAYELTLMSDRLPQNQRCLIGNTIAHVIQRADELTEFLAIYWKDGKRPLSGQTKKGLRAAFAKFNEYHLGKYDRDKAVKLRDVAMLSHVKAGDSLERGKLYSNLINKVFVPEKTKSSEFPVRTAYGLSAKAEGLATPDTWEVELSAGKDKRETFERLIREGKLGYMALLRNLRNMKEAGVTRGMVATALRAGAPKSKALPFRFIAAARAVPAWEPDIEEAMLVAAESLPKLKGRTTLLIDTSPSMNAKLFAKSDLRRVDAAAALAILLANICDEFTPWAFSREVKQVPPRKGFALADAIQGAVESNGTLLGRALGVVDRPKDYDRLIVITDEESQDPVPNPNGQAYMINVASTRNGVGYAPWIHVDGFSEAVVDWIRAYETEKYHEEALG